jgi:hypothetical protein
MPAAEFLLVTVVTGLLLIGVGVALARRRSVDRSAFLVGAEVASRRALPAPAGGTGGVRSDVVSLAVVVGVVVLAGVAAVVGPMMLALAAAPALVVGYFAWGIYSLARSRGFPRAHAVGVSAWLFGVVLVGVVAAKLLVG